MTDVRCIAIDVMGGDSGPSVTVPACLSILRRHLTVRLLLVGDESLIKLYLNDLSASVLSRLEILHTSLVFTNEARPDTILRNGRDSSLFLAVEQVRSESAHACVSAGNTGALMLTARHLLKNIPGVEKPAIMAILPASRAGGFTYLLDVGANIECTANQLFQFAMMGSVLVSSLAEKSRARVALLNVGAEAHKGKLEIREASVLLAACKEFEYVGFVEGNQIFDGLADVIVCDGFTGNVTIKTSAGAVKVIQNLIHQSIRKRWYYRVFAFWMKPFLRDVRRALKPSRYNGATLIGVQGVIVKSHGNSDRAGFEQAIEHALRQLEFDIPDLIAKRMQIPVEHFVG
ncbi:MAG: phosphate acyltransferase PlsX [Pseudohongiella sp.]|nr:phosphate acyltransferase PlsX [Pseudohongiella sp.]